MNQQAIEYINKKIEKYSKVVSDMDTKYIWNEIKYTYHGWFDHWYAKWKLTALEDMKDELQALWDEMPNNSEELTEYLNINWERSVMLEHAQPKGERALLSETLILASLALTGKTMEDMTEPEFVHRTQWFPELYHWRLNWLLSIGKFYAFLLSPEFIEKYELLWIEKYENDEVPNKYIASEFWVAIHDYQNGDSQLLIELLSKITR